MRAGSAEDAMHRGLKWSSKHGLLVKGRGGGRKGDGITGELFAGLISHLL